MIIIFEPQCVGFEHVEFNAAFIIVVGNAFKDERILFAAEFEHLNHVKKILENNSVDIDYKELKVPKRSLSDFFRFPLEFTNVMNIFNLAKELKSTNIIFSSVRSSTLISIKLLIRFHKRIRVLTVLHGFLNYIFNQPVTPTEFIFWVKFSLKFFNSKRLTYLVLGDYIKKDIIKELPNVNPYLDSIEMPCLYKSYQLTYLDSNRKIIFGYLGIVHDLKGVDVFFNLSDEINRGKNNAEFIVIGHVSDDFVKKLPKSVFVPSPEFPLSVEEYEYYIQSVDYVIFAYEKKYYRLRASATLFDAFSYIKPIIALRNPYFEYYFEKMGDIGYLCDSYEELKELVSEIIKKRPNERYLDQQRNILKGRNEFSFKELAEKLARTWN
jgi:glycosyltransferase involved in cell wall biosynthesis